MLSIHQKEAIIFSVIFLVMIGGLLGYNNLRMTDLEEQYSQQLVNVKSDVYKNNQALAYQIKKLQEELRIKNSALEKQIKENNEQLETGITGRLSYQQQKLDDVTKTLQKIQMQNGDKISLLEHELKSLNIQTENYADMIQDALLSVVTIDTLAGKGSGFITKTNDKEAFIVTSYHLLEEAPDEQKVVVVRTNQQETYEGKLVGFNERYDIALLSIATKGKTVQPISFGDSNDISVGDTVFALGNPGGFGVSVTEGIISATNRFVNGIPFMQTDSTINKGSSGGPLINKQGQVIGMNNLKIVGLEDVNLATPSQLIKKIVDEMMAKKG